jgi:hypothetical protein
LLPGRRLHPLQDHLGRLEDRIRLETDTVDVLLYQEVGKVRIVTGGLIAVILRRRGVQIIA